jgi:hypothetical protein
MGERVNEDFKLIRKVLEIQRKIKHFVYLEDQQICMCLKGQIVQFP